MNREELCKKIKDAWEKGLLNSEQYMDLHRECNVSEVSVTKTMMKEFLNENAKERVERINAMYNIEEVLSQ